MPGNQAGESLDDWFAHLPFESLFLSFFAVQILCCGTSAQSGVVKVNSFGCTTQPRRVHLECFPVDPSLAPPAIGIRQIRTPEAAPGFGGQHPRFTSAKR
jgi:hypothetical protein